MDAALQEEGAQPGRAVVSPLRAVSQAELSQVAPAVRPHRSRVSRARVASPAGAIADAAIQHRVSTGAVDMVDTGIEVAFLWASGSVLALLIMEATPTDRLTLIRVMSMDRRTRRQPALAEPTMRMVTGFRIRTAIRISNSTPLNRSTRHSSSRSTHQRRRPNSSIRRSSRITIPISRSRTTIQISTTADNRCLAGWLTGFSLHLPGSASPRLPRHLPLNTT